MEQTQEAHPIVELERSAFMHWSLQRDTDNILWLRLDQKDASANLLGTEVLGELTRIVDMLEQQPSNSGAPSALAFISDKDAGFIAGADINMIEQLQDLERPVDRLLSIQQIFNRIEALPYPTVAAIHGYCLGGGLELALACRFRIATADAKLGFPEVKLGLHPGWGGAVRLPRLIGVTDAMDMILGGKPVSGERAHELGLVDHIAPRRQFANAALAIVRDNPKPHEPSLGGKILNASLLSGPVASELQRRLRKRADRSHYPAPYAVVELWDHHSRDTDKMLHKEAESFVAMSRTPASQNLRRIFLLQQEMKAQGRNARDTIQHVHIIGAGAMGGGIAAWCALKGLRVTLQDQNPESLAEAYKHANGLFRDKLGDKRLAMVARDRLTPDPEGVGLAWADLVLEAIPEKLEAKRQLYQEIEPRMKSDATLASNTSSIPIDELARGLAHPERLVGLHFFNPVEKMLLVEVIKGDKTSQQTLDRAMAFAALIKRVPTPVNSAPGFFVNRVLTPYLLEAMIMFDEGVPAETLDAAAEEFGMAMGPAETVDLVGLDICLDVAEHMSGLIRGDAPAMFKNWVSKERLGRKTGQGFYEYKDGEPQKTKVSRPDDQEMEALRQRMIYRMLNEAVACLREKVIEQKDHGDLAMVLGAGFAPFRGGPFRYIQACGPTQIKRMLTLMAQDYGDRFTPDRGWEMPALIADEERGHKQDRDSQTEL
ncbi:3-hydroxyacyl-CoA dehydrogenase [Hahella chejuensis KCTC 2396]|uniref:enoyl-CoA hydratase n=1 Tax=Hahella chejuensis (strain KCTC 2396) TaxID=349521 RepID=Q2SGR6_HAHCH|nr:3-hydroxyacyl-CoA dehydrogenase NAD-binding domain-containing protein [Hahella chejuensis]ABC30158.1 3-hydroxyacyl-CoA dehydrogenase [Hahella chejuensis KCTC 2396]